MFNCFYGYEVKDKANLNLHKIKVPAETADLFWFSNNLPEKIQTYSIWSLQVRDSILILISLLIVVTYHVVSWLLRWQSREISWELSSDTLSEAVSNTTARNRHYEIMRHSN